MALKLKGSTSGFTAIDAPAVAGDNTLVLPADNGSASQYLQTNGSGVLSWATVTDTDTTGWTWDTTGDTLTSQSSVSVTGIPSDATQIIVAVRDMSAVDDINPILQAGTSSGLDTTNYESVGFYVGNGSTGASYYANGWRTWGGAAGSYVFNGFYHLTKLNGNNWYCNARLSIQASFTNSFFVAGHVELGGTLDRVAILPQTGSFDSGTVFVHYFTP